MNANLSTVLQTKPYIIGCTMYAAHVHFSTTLANISAIEWPSYITSDIMPWRSLPAEIIAKKKKHSRTTTKHVALDCSFDSLCRRKVIDSRSFLYNISKH